MWSSDSELAAASSSSSSSTTSASSPPPSPPPAASLLRRPRNRRRRRANRQIVHSGGAGRRGGPVPQPDGRRPRGAQGLRRPGVRVQLRRDPRAPRHAPGARALLLHEPAPPRRQAPPGGLRPRRRLRRRHAGDAARHQLEDLQPRRQPRRGESAAQVLGAGRGVHRPPLQLNAVCR